MNTAIKITILATNAALALALVYLLAINRITWDQLLVALGLLLVPSAGGVAMMRSDGKSTPPPPNASSVLFVCALASALAACGVGLSGCALFTPKNAKSALTDIQIVCALAHAESDDATIAQICGVADVFIPDLKKILDAHRAELAKAKKIGCGGGA